MERPPFEPSEGNRFMEVAAELVAMVTTDQEMRARSLEDSEYWDDEVDARNTARLKEIVAEIGWPTMSKVGLEAAHSAWLLVQHADHDVAFQEECLELMKAAGPRDVSSIDLAYLEDRVRVNKGMSQLYGTQFFEENGTLVPKPIEDQEGVDERRKQAGLDSLEEGIKRMRKKYE